MTARLAHPALNPCQSLSLLPPSSPLTPEMDSYVQDSYESSQPSQTQTQPQTQVAAQADGPARNLPSHLWGLLTGWAASSSELFQLDRGQRQLKPGRLELSDDKFRYQVGRHPRCELRLDGKKISSFHADIFLDQGDGQVKIRDTSTNGTTVRNTRLSKGEVTVLQSGDSIIFGALSHNPLEDFRYTFQGAVSVADRDNLFGDSDGGGIRELYDVQEQIGKGSFATVRRAIDRRTGTTVAVKIVNKARFIGNPKTMEMIRREIAIMKQIDHVSRHPLFAPLPSCEADPARFRAAEILRQVHRLL